MNETNDVMSSSNGQEPAPAPTSKDLEEATTQAERFLRAVDAGDRHGVWALFSDNARAYVLNRAVDKGMDFDLMSAIRQGTADEEDIESYLGDLVDGLRHDLRGVELTNLKFEAKPAGEPVGQVNVTYLLEMDVAIGDRRPSIPAGSVVMAPEGDDWKVERLVPRPG